MKTTSRGIPYVNLCFPFCLFYFGALLFNAISYFFDCINQVGFCKVKRKIFDELFSEVLLGEGFSMCFFYFIPFIREIIQCIRKQVRPNIFSLYQIFLHSLSKSLTWVRGSNPSLKLGIFVVVDSLFPLKCLVKYLVMTIHVYSVDAYVSQHLIYYLANDCTKLYN